LKDNPDCLGSVEEIKITTSPSLSSHTYLINNHSEDSHVSTHKVMRNKRMSKAAALESQYVMQIGNQHELESKVSDLIEHEIGCPRCYNVM